MSVCVCVSDVEVEGGKRFERRREWTTTAFERGTDSRPTRARARTIYSQDFTDRLRQQMEEDASRSSGGDVCGCVCGCVSAWEGSIRMTTLGYECREGVCVRVRALNPPSLTHARAHTHTRTHARLRA